MIYLLAIIINFLSALTKINIIITGIFCGLIYQIIHKYNYDYNYITNISDFGILAMMFIIGAHIDIKQLKKHLVTIIAIICTTIVCAFVCLPIIHNLLLTTWLQSFIISIALCLSSTMNCQNILKVKGRISADYSQIALLGTIAQDLIGIICIIYMHTINRNYNVDVFNIMLSHIILCIIIFFILIIYKQIKGLWIKFATTINMQNYNILVITSILLINYFGDFCYQFGISKEIIFLFAGILLKQAVKDNEITITSIQNLFLTLIFITSGYNIDIFSLTINFYKVLILVLYISITKFLLCYFAISFVKKDVEISILSALLLTSFSEIIFFLIFMLDIDSTSSTILALATIISIFSTPFIFDFCEEIFNKIRIKTFGFARRAARKYILNIDNYNLIIGINQISICLAQKFGEKIEATVIIDKNLEKINSYKNDNFLYLDAITKETYDALNIDKIKNIIICTQKIEIAEKISQLIRKFNQEIRIIYLSYIHNNSVSLLQNIVKTFVIKKNEMEDSLESIVESLIEN